MKLQGKCFFLHKSFGCRGKKRGNKIKITTQKKTNLIQKDGGEERQEEYPASAPLYHEVCGTDVGLVFLSFFFAIFLY